MLCLGMLNGPAKDARRVVAAAADTAEAAAGFASSTLRAATTTTNTSSILISSLGEAALQLARDALKEIDVSNHECTGGTLQWLADDMDIIQVAAQQLVDNRWFNAAPTCGQTQIQSTICCGWALACGMCRLNSLTSAALAV
jgi:hypothetical protein